MPRKQRDLRHVLDAIAAGVVVIDGAATIREMNAEACRILETSSGTMRRRSLDEALGAGHPVVDLARDVLANGRGTREAGLRVKTRFSAELLLDAAASPLFDEAGEPDGAVIELRDRTISSTLQEVVEERNRMLSFGQIAAGIAHEVKNPLGGIRGAAEILARRSDDPKLEKITTLIVQEADRIADLLDDFMVIGKDDRLRLESVNVHRILDDVLDLLAMDPVAGGAKVERAFDPSIPEFLADRDRLVQVFHNLCRNALQSFGQNGGSLTIGTRMALDHHLSTEEGERAPSVVIEVHDDGPGIPQHVLERLTTPFFTTRAEGTGLGLTMSRHWVTRHDGRLQIDSTPGEGTTARVFLPLRRNR